MTKSAYEVHSIDLTQLYSVIDLVFTSAPADFFYASYLISLEASESVGPACNNDLKDDMKNGPRMIFCLRQFKSIGKWDEIYKILSHDYD